MKITYVLEKFRRNPGKHPVVGGLNGHVVLPCYQANTIGMRSALYISPTLSHPAKNGLNEFDIMGHLITSPEAFTCQNT
jgi:hypothetical protein